MSKKIKIQYHLDKERVGIIQIDNPQKLDIMADIM